MSKKIEIREGKNKIEANCKRINNIWMDCNKVFYIIIKFQIIKTFARATISVQLLA